MTQESAGRGQTVLTVARKELIECSRDGRLRVMAAAILMLLIAALAAGWLNNRQERRAVAVATEAERSTWLDQGPKNPHSAAHFGNYAFKPRPALAALDQGVDAYLGIAVWLEAHWQDPFSLRPAEDRTALQQFGQLSAAFTLQVLAPLLVVLFGFAAFAGEREHGTLLQLASVGVSGPTLALGKTLGLAAALLLVLGPATVLGTAVAMLSRDGGVSAGSLSSGVAAGAVLLLVYGVYYGVLLAVVLAVSAWARTARAALVVLLALWLVSTLVVPRLAADLAERAYPIPTPRAFYAAIAEDEARGMEGQGTREERRQALQERLLAEYEVQSLEELPVNFAGLSLQASEEHSNLVFDRHFGRLWGLYADQQQLHLAAGLLSPRLAVRALSMALAGTDLGSHRHFSQAAEQHRRILVKFLNEDMIQNAGQNSFGYLADDELWRAAPTFEYRPPGLGQTLRAQLPALVLLAAWLLAGVLLVFRTTTRLQVLPGGGS